MKKFTAITVAALMGVLVASPAKSATYTMQEDVIWCTSTDHYETLLGAAQSGTNAFRTAMTQAFMRGLCEPAPSGKQVIVKKRTWLFFGMVKADDPFGRVMWAPKDKVDIK